jgi:hypothetical protein
MSCDTTHTLKFKHRKAEKLDGGLESFYALMESESVETLKKTKTTATCSIFRNESRRQDNVLDYVVRVAWDFPGLEIQYESKDEYNQYEEKEICIEQESSDRLGALIDAAEEDPESQLKLGLMYLEEESNTLDLNDWSQPEPMDPEQGIKWLQKAAGNGLAKAHGELARLYSESAQECAGLAHALVAQKMDENEENEKLIKSISSSMNQKDKRKAKKLAEEIVGNIDDSAVVSTRSPGEVLGEILWLIKHDDLKALKKLMQSADYHNAIMFEDGYSITPVDLYKEALEFGSYASAAWICDLGFFSPVCFSSDSWGKRNYLNWDNMTELVNQEKVRFLNPSRSGRDTCRYNHHQPPEDKNTYYWDLVDDDKKELDKFLSHVLGNHASVPHCISWDRKGAEELLEAARSKKMNKTVSVLKKHLEGK